MDARWYNPHTHRFVQPDYWNLRNTHLPAEIQHELMRFTGLNTDQLLNDPSQQMRYGYVSGNPSKWVDPWGLCLPAETDGSVNKEATIWVLEDNINTWVEANRQRIEDDFSDKVTDTVVDTLRVSSERVGYAATIAVISSPLGWAAKTLAATASTLGIVGSGTDFTFNSNMNEAAIAGTATNESLRHIGKIMSPLAPKPVAIGFDATSQVSNFIFSEAARNEDSKNDERN
jgi:hypothetical protein